MKTLHYSIIITGIVFSSSFFLIPSASSHIIPGFSIQPDPNYIDPVTHFQLTKENHPHIALQQDSEFTLPMILKSNGNNGSFITSYWFHVTDGNDFTAEVMPKGMSIKIVPDHLFAGDGSVHRFNIVIKVGKNAPSGVYASNLVTKWNNNVTQSTDVSPIYFQVGKWNWNSLSKQLERGISAKNVICKLGLQLVIKSEDGYPACVKPASVDILVKRGWAHDGIIQSSDIPHIINPLTNTSPSAENLTYVSPIIPKTHDARGAVSWTLPNTPLRKIASSTTGIQITRGGSFDTYDHDSVRLELYYGKTSDSNIIASTVVNMRKMPVHIYGISIQGRTAYTNDTSVIALQSMPEIMPKEDAILGQGESQTKYIVGNWTVMGKPVNVFSVYVWYSYNDLQNYNGMTDGYVMNIPVYWIK